MSFKDSELGADYKTVLETVQWSGSTKKGNKYQNETYKDRILDIKKSQAKGKGKIKFNKAKC